MSKIPAVEPREDPLEDRPESFFHQLLRDRSHIEVNVSRAFAMCFRESPVFAHAVARLLCSTCGIRVASPNTTWRCRTEVTFSKGRPDLEIHSPTVAFFRLESKVGAPLNKEQLRRYKTKGKNRFLIALTKRSPDVGRRWMKQQGILSIRWQDVHRVVAGATARGRDEYLCNSFCLYLEELGMAHREAVRRADLVRLHEMFNAVGGNTKWKFVSPKNAFEVAESCLLLLREVARDARDQVPALESWSRRGPYYSKGPDGQHVYHHLGFSFYRKGGRESVGAGLTFRQGSKYMRWEVSRRQKNQGLDESTTHPVEGICGKDQALDRERMLQAFVKSARELGLRV